MKARDGNTASSDQAFSYLEGAGEHYAIYIREHPEAQGMESGREEPTACRRRRQGVVMHRGWEGGTKADLTLA